MKFLKNKIRDQDIFGQSVGFNYSQSKEEFKSGCSGFFSIVIKIALFVILYLRAMAVLQRSDNLYGVFENFIDEESVNEVNLDDQGFLIYFEFIQLPYF